MSSIENALIEIAAVETSNREEVWLQIIRQISAENFLELGILRGVFAEFILRECPSIAHYYMLDPWCHLENWNKPSNVDQVTFENIYALAMARTDFAREKRIVLRGRTIDVIDQIPDGCLDVAYIDGDHTLRGISIDLIRTYPKVRPGGVLGGDDYTRTIWQHPESFEPTMVCPFAAYFAESQGAPLIVLPHNQFAIIKPSMPGYDFRVIDTTQSYGALSLLSQITKRL